MIILQRVERYFRMWYAGVFGKIFLIYTRFKSVELRSKSRKGYCELVFTLTVVEELWVIVVKYYSLSSTSNNLKHGVVAACSDTVVCVAIIYGRYNNSLAFLLQRRYFT